MFTGIIKAKGKVEKITKGKAVLHMSFVAPKSWKFKNGESVSVAGICTTVVESKKNVFEVDYMKETLSKTTVAEWRAGKIVNLEKSLKFGDPMDGHLVYGHIDTVGRVVQNSKLKIQNSLRIVIPKQFLAYVEYKGSVAVDGVSLTVSKKGMDYFEVSLIPYTLKHTTLGDLKKGDKVNVETDIFLKQKMSVKS